MNEGGVCKSRGPPLADRAYEISKSFKLAKDFEISPEISRFHQRFQDFTKDFRDFRISPKISGISRRFRRFQDFTKLKDFSGFQGSLRDFMPS